MTDSQTPDQSTTQTSPAMEPQVLIITGMSGAGRSTAARALEDLEYRVIDNLPPHLISAVIDHHGLAEQPSRLAVVVDTRGGLTPDALRTSLDDLHGQGIATLVLLLDADEGTLLRRYTENRRPHPMRRTDLVEAIAAERSVISEVAYMADVVVDTTDLNVHDLRRRLTGLFAEGRPPREMRVSLTSFGFKHGIPRDADLLFDVRFLPNPHWQPELRPLRGTDPPVAEYVLNQPDARVFMTQVEEMLNFLIPRFQYEGKSYLSIAIGCTGGHHRSVAITEYLASWLKRDIGVDVHTRHRDVSR